MCIHFITFLHILWFSKYFYIFLGDVFLLWNVPVNYGCNLKKVFFRNSLRTLLTYSGHSLSWKSSMSVSLIQMSAVKLKLQVSTKSNSDNHKKSKKLLERYQMFKCGLDTNFDHRYSLLNLEIRQKMTWYGLFCFLYCQK